MKLQKKAPVISVIVPVYQVAPYLRACLDSILAQSFTDWELLLIDDGSTDGGETICDEYGKKDARIRVFHLGNHGLSAARNFGLDHSLGEYIAMVDSDDVLLSRDYLLLLYRAIAEECAQISVCDFQDIQENDRFEMVSSEAVPITLVSGRSIFREKDLNVFRFSSACAKIYHRDCFARVRYPVGKLLEDVYTFHHLVYPCQRIAVLDLAMYGRRRRGGSITTGTNSARLFQETRKANEDCISYLLKQGDEEAVACAENHILNSELYYYLNAVFDGTADRIPENIRPEPEDYEPTHGYAYLLHTFRRGDPHFSLPQTAAYRESVTKDAACALLLGAETMFQKKIYGPPKRFKMERLLAISQNERIHALCRKALSQISSDDSDEKEKHDQYIHFSMRRSILLWAQQKRIRDELKKSDLVLIPVFPTALLALYPDRWLKEQEAPAYVIDERELPELRRIMKRLSFTETETDPLEAERNVEYIFENREGLRISFLTGAPYVFYGRYGRYLNALHEMLHREQREMTVAEYAVCLTIKLHKPLLSVASASLSDLLELALIIKEFPGIAEDSMFQNGMRELSLEETWEEYAGLCKKIMQAKGEAELEEKEFALIFAIIGAPHFKQTELKKRSAVLLKERRLSDPIEYAVSKEKGLVYLVNSKAACSSIKAAMLAEEVPDDYSVHTRMLVNHMIRTKLSREEASYFAFTFVRDPFARLVSCYESKYHTDIEKYKIPLPIANVQYGYMAYDDGFSSFVRKVCSLPYRLMDRHFRRQYDLVYDEEGGSRCNYIGHFEELEKEFSPILQEHALPSLPLLNKTGVTNWKDYYTHETAEMVYKTFEKDIVTFGYKKIYQELLSYLAEQRNNNSTKRYVGDVE